MGESSPVPKDGPIVARPGFIAWCAFKFDVLIYLMLAF